MTTKPTICIITPTADQPTGIALLERYVAAQTVQPDRWIVADDGEVAANLTMGQIPIRATHPRSFKGAKSLANNFQQLLTQVNEDIVIVMEHDDYYAPNHIEVQVNALADETILATGCRIQRYYNVQHRMWIQLNNVGASLCNTAFKMDLIYVMADVSHEAFVNDAIGLDRMFWDRLIRMMPCAVLLHDIHTCVGIKGLPGIKGLGMGHRPMDKPAKFTLDHTLAKLIEWIGNEDDASVYAKFWNHYNDE